MEIQKITLEIDQQQYEALQGYFQLRGLSVEAELQKRMDRCCRDLVLEEKQRALASVAEITPLSFLRVIDQGKTRCIQMDGIDTVEAAARLTQYLAGGPSVPSETLEEAFPKQKSITEEEFTTHAFELLGNSRQVAGVFDVSLDAGTFSTLDADWGWRTFTAANIRAISRWLAESGITDKAAAFRDLPLSKQTANPERLSRLGGGRPIKAEDITLRECLVDEDGVITFIVDVLAREREVFGVELYADADSYFVFYAVYNTNTKQVSDTLDISLMRPAETVQFVCPIPPETAEGLRQKMDGYCVTWSGKHLDELEPPSHAEWIIKPMM